MLCNTCLNCTAVIVNILLSYFTKMSIAEGVAGVCVSCRCGDGDMGKEKHSSRGHSYLKPFHSVSKEMTHNSAKYDST